MLARLRPRLSFANVTSVLALFIALGGTGYAAVTLPRNSVGSTQIKKRAVGSSELKTNAVTSRACEPLGRAERPLGPRAASRSAGSRGRKVPPARPASRCARPFRPAAPSSAATPSAPRTRAGPTSTASAFDRDISSCVATATLASVPTAGGTDQPTAGRITVTQDQPTSVLVRTFAADGTPAEQPFNVIIAC